MITYTYNLALNHLVHGLAPSEYTMPTAEFVIFHIYLVAWLIWGILMWSYKFGPRLRSKPDMVLVMFLGSTACVGLINFHAEIETFFGQSIEGELAYALVSGLLIIIAGLMLGGLLRLADLGQQWFRDWLDSLPPPTDKT